ncbi:MAG: hypothetical protein PVF83_18315 [Anaerolineales bacterium]
MEAFLTEILVRVGWREDSFLWGMAVSPTPHCRGWRLPGPLRLNAM